MCIRDSPPRCGLLGGSLAEPPGCARARRPRVHKDLRGAAGVQRAHLHRLRQDGVVLHDAEHPALLVELVQQGLRVLLGGLGLRLGLSA
eukprot:2739147-Alexandrium_andersonii.AAC.1